MNEKYYVAIVIYKSSSDNASYKNLFEESFVLIKATTEENARQKLEVLSQARETKYKNEQGDEISWDLHKVVDVAQMLEDEINNVTEIYSRHFNNIEAYNTFEVLSK